MDEIQSAALDCLKEKALTLYEEAATKGTSGSEFVCFAKFCKYINPYTFCWSFVFGWAVRGSVHRHVFTSQLSRFLKHIPLKPSLVGNSWLCECTSSLDHIFESSFSYFFLMNGTFGYIACLRLGWDKERFTNWAEHSEGAVAATSHQNVSLHFDAFCFPPKYKLTSALSRQSQVSTRSTQKYIEFYACLGKCSFASLQRRHRDWHMVHMLLLIFSSEQEA